MGRIRSQSAVQGTVVADGADNDETDPRIILFSAYVRPCIIMNGTGNGNVIRAKINAETDGTVSNDFDNDSDDDGPGYVTVADGETADLSLNGQLCVTSVSFITTDAGDDLDNVAVVGWDV